MIRAWMVAALLIYPGAGFGAVRPSLDDARAVADHAADALDTFLG